MCIRDSLYTGTDGLAQQYITEIENWEAALSDITAALQANDTEQVYQLIQTACTPRLNQAVSTGHTLIDQLTAQTNTQTEAVGTSSTVNMVIQVILMAAIFIGGIALNLRTIRGIVSPLREMCIRDSSRAGAGVLSSRSADRAGSALAGAGWALSGAAGASRLSTWSVLLVRLFFLPAITQRLPFLLSLIHI